MKTTDLKGSRHCDLKEAYELGIITEAQFKELEPTTIKPKINKPWISYMDRTWRPDYKN